MMVPRYPAPEEVAEFSRRLLLELKESPEVSFGITPQGNLVVGGDDGGDFTALGAVRGPARPGDASAITRYVSDRLRRTIVQAPPYRTET